MKKITILALASAVVFGASAKSEKRGHCINSLTQTQLELLTPGASWFYNWAGTPPANLSDVDGFDFVPMIWGGSYNADRIREYCKAHPRTKYLLGFNEPNFKKQANLTPAQAAEKWPEIKALADELGLKLVSPALNFSPDAPYQDPYKWMDEFVGLVGNDAFDYIAFHCYGGTGLIKDMVEKFNTQYGKQVWVTEYNYWPGGAGNVYVAPEVQRRTIVETTRFFEQSDKVFRYSWFMATGPYDSSDRANYGLVGVGGTLSAPEYFLTPQGYVYTYLGTFDKDAWNPVNTWIAAADANDLEGVNFDHIISADATQLPSPIGVNDISAGNWLEFNFDIASADNHKLNMLCAGEGEPVRFDPAMTITLDGKEIVTNEKFTLTGAADKFKTQTWDLGHVEAGHHTVRLTYTGRTSGLVISAVALSNPTSLEDIATDMTPADTPAEYFNLQGQKISNPAAGQIYIRRQGSEAVKIRL